MKSLSISQSMRNIQGKQKLVFGCPDSIKTRYEAEKLYKKFKRSGLSESGFYWEQEIKFFMR